MRLGVCYYPEHWPEEWWAEDARQMVAMGLSRVRIGEFAWSRIEPTPGRYDWDWLDRAVAILAEAGLGIILGTPTATPPKWLVDAMPDMLAIDESGRARAFGSRRHYCFSHAGYRAECARIVAAVAERYGDHAAVVAWQTDNEYGCHETVISYSPSAAKGFRKWLAARYGDIAALNIAWGTVFWSQEYASFEAIDPPVAAVTEQHPAHLLDWRRFASDEVVAFNRIQTDTLRAASPGRDLVHNYMGFFTQFDHHAVARDLDVAGWDSYPLGFLEQFWFSPAEKLRYARTGQPDIAAFHHDLYRGCTGVNGQGRLWVLEQQPGPVNWARYNPAPAAGMVRLWTLEAMAHGAELVSYFRWRQAPFAQEAMHAGLLRPDCAEAPAAAEVRAAAADIEAVGSLGVARAPVALVFDYASIWAIEAQRQGEDYHGLQLAFEVYRALRKLGLDVDIAAPSAALEGYAMIVVPCLVMLPEGFADRLAGCAAPVLLGPRTGSKTTNFAIPVTLPPGDLQRLMPLKVVRVESLRPGLEVQGDGFTVTRWIEDVETVLDPEVMTYDERGVVYRHGHVRYVTAWPDAALLDLVLRAMADEAGVDIVTLGDDVRFRNAGNLRFAFNYGPDPASLSALLKDAPLDLILGDEDLPAAGVAAWRV